MSIQKVFRVEDKYKECLGKGEIKRPLQDFIKYGASLRDDGLIVKEVIGPYYCENARDEVYIIRCDKVQSNPRPEPLKPSSDGM